MLVLSRKSEQTIAVGSDIVITIVAVKGKRVTIGIEAPEDVRIRRGELAADATATATDAANPLASIADSTNGTDLSQLSVAT